METQDLLWPHNQHDKETSQMGDLESDSSSHR